MSPRCDISRAFLLASLLIVGANSAIAAVTVTAASGGANISADKAANAASPAWTMLGNIVISENAEGDFAAGTNQTLILTAPGGWKFNTLATVATSVTGGSGVKNLVVNSVVLTDSTIMLTITVSGTNRTDILTVSGIQVQSKNGAILPISGDILRTSSNPGTANIAGITSDSTNFGSLSQTAGAAAKLSVAAQPSTPDTAGIPFRTQPAIQVLDQFNNLRSAANGSADNTTLVTATRSGGSGTLQGTTTATAANGVARFLNLRHDVAGTITISFTSGSLTGATSTSIIIIPSSPYKLVFVQQPSNATAGTTIMPAVTVQVKDSLGNNVSASALPITMSLTTGNGTLSGTTLQPTNASGLATFNDLSINASGTKNITASRAGLLSGVSNAFTIFAGAPASVKFVQQPTTTSAGSNVTPAVTVGVRDAFGNTVSTPGVSVTVSLASGTGALGGITANITDASGLATFDSLRINLVGTKTLRAASGPLAADTSEAFSIVAGAASQLAFVQQPTNTAAGAIITPSVTTQLQDAFGNNVSTSGVPVTVSLSSGSGTLGGTTTRTTNTSGVATFNDLGINLSGSKTLTASSAGLTPTASSSFTIASLGAAQLVFVQQPSSAAAGATISPPVTVQVQDVFGNNVDTQGIAVTLTLSSGTGTLSGTTTHTTSATGLATFNDLSVNLTGSKALTASSSGLKSAISNAFTITTAGVPKKLAFVQQPTTATAGAFITPAVTVQLQDSLGNSLSSAGVSIALALTSGFGALSGTAMQVTNSDGLATFNDLSINIAGTNKRLTASSAGLASDSSSIFTVNPAAPSQLAYIQQPSNTSTYNAIAPAVAVQLRDQFGNSVPTAGLAVTMTLSSGTGTLAGTTTRNTDATGVATFGDLRINVTGSKNLAASGTGLTSAVSNSFSVSAGAFIKLQLLMPGETAAPGTVSGKAGTPAPRTAGAAFSVTVNAVDSSWNVVSSATDVVGITTSDPNGVLPTNAALVSGTGSFGLTFKTAGSRAVTASDMTTPARTASTSPATTVNPGAFTKLQILVPGETPAPGTASGNTGTPTAQTAGSAFTVTVNAVDAYWNLVNTIGDVVSMTSTDPNAILPSDALLASGTRTFSITLRTAGAETVIASDVTDGSKSLSVSPSITVNPGPFSKLQLLVPGESALPGSSTGKTGTPSTQFVGGSFTVTVNAVDANWNLVSSSDVIGITSTDASATLPPNAPLAGGTKSYNVTFGTAGGQTLTATDITNGARMPNTCPTLTVNPAGIGTVTSATGGDDISADDEGGAFTPLTGPTYNESSSGNAGVGTIVLDVPAGFIFDTEGTAPTVLVTRIGGKGGRGRNINGVRSLTSLAVSSITSTQITFLITSASNNGVTNSLTWQNIRVRPTAGSPLASGNITSSGTSTFTGVTAGSTSFGTLTEVAGAPVKLVITLPGQTFTSGSGNSGTPTAQTAGTSFVIPGITVTDQFLNRATSYNGVKSLNYTGPAGTATYTTSVSFASGQSTTTLMTALSKAQMTTLTVSDGTITGPASSSLTVNPGAFTKLQLLVPGEVAAPGTPSGKTGTPTSQNGGAAFSVTVNAVDANWNLLSASDIVGITSSDPSATLPANAALVNGAKTFSVSLIASGSHTITASDITQPSRTPNTSPAISVNAGAFAKLQILLPEEMAAPGTPTGKTGKPTAQTAGVPFTVTVNAVDANWNLINTLTDSVGITTTDVSAALPAYARLVAGTKSYGVTLKTAGTQTLTATDFSDGTKTLNTSPAVTVSVGPFVKLQILLPGELAAPGTSSGKTGSPTAQSAGSGFTLTVNAVDANWNLVNTVTDIVGITSSNGSATLPATAALVAGVQTFSLTFNSAGSATITSSDISDGTKTPGTSSSVTVNPVGTGKVAPATGGSALSADSTGRGYTTLTGPAYSESTPGNVDIGTVILKIPPGFMFDSGGIPPRVQIDRLAGVGADSLNINRAASGTSLPVTSMTDSTITFTVTSKSTGGVRDALTWQNIRVRPRMGTPLASGNITMSSLSTASLTGVTNESTSFGTLTEVAGAMVRLVVTLPGQTFVEGTGNTASVANQTAGVSFDIARITASDQFFNIVSSYSGVKTVSYSGATGAAAFTTGVSFTNGRSTATLTTVLDKAETISISVSDGTVTGPASSPLTIVRGSFTKLQILVPGESAAPGTPSGKTGTPTIQAVGVPFSFTVNAVDAKWNPVASSDVVTITSSDLSALLPANAALVGGTRTLTVTLNAAGAQSIIASDSTQSSKTAATSPAITVTAGAFAKLQILLPGEAAAPGTPSGKTGSASARTAGTSFSVTVNAVDANWNVVDVNDVVGVTSSDANGAMPANAPLVHGTRTLSVTLTTAGTATLTASDIDQPSKTTNTSPSFGVSPGAFTKLQLLVPGETAAPGTNTGKAGTPSTQVTGTAISATVKAVDANWNPVTATDVVSMTSSDPIATLPPNAALVNGTRTFTLTFGTSGSQTLTVSDVTQLSKTANTSPSITVNSGAAIFSTTTGGNWSATSTWVGGVVPGNNSDVVIATTGGGKVTIDVSTETIRTLTINPGAILQGGGAFTITLGRAAGTDFSNAGTFDANGVTVRLTRDSQWAGSGTFNLTSLDFNTKTLALAFASLNTVRLSGAGDPFLNPGTLIPGVNSTIQYNGSAAQTVNGSASVKFNNLEINGAATVTLSSAITTTKVAGSLSVLGGTFANGGFAITLANNQSFSVSNGATFRLSGTSAMAAVTGIGTKTFAASSTTNYAGTNQTVSSETYGNLTLSGSGTKTTTAIPLTVGGTLTVSGTTSVTVGAGMEIHGDVILNVGSTLNGASFTHTVLGNWTNNGGSFVGGTSTVLFGGSSSQVIGGSTGTTFNALQFSGSGMKTINVGLTINAGITVSAGASVTISNTGSLSMAGNLNNDGIVTNNGTISVQ